MRYMEYDQHFLTVQQIPFKSLHNFVRYLLQEVFTL